MGRTPHFAPFYHKTLLNVNESLEEFKSALKSKNEEHLPSMVFILDSNSNHVWQILRKIGFFSEEYLDY